MSRGVGLGVLLVAGAVAVVAQPLPYGGVIESLVTNGDGSELYFSTRQPLKTGSQHVQGRIFRLTSSGLELADEVEYSAPSMKDGLSFSFSNYYDLSNPQISSDGSVFAYVAGRDCWGDGCFNQVLRRTIFKPAVPQLDTEPGGLIGTGRISRNGRYWVTFQRGVDFPADAQKTSVADLVTGQVQTYPYFSLPAEPGDFSQGRVVADDGTAVLPYGGLMLFQGDSAGYIRGDFRGGSDAVISADASTIVFRGQPPLSGPLSWDDTLMAYDLNTKQTRNVIGGRDGYSINLSADGSRILYVSSESGTPQVWTVNIDGSSETRVTNEPCGVSTAVMSDDGHAAWYVTFDGRIVQLDLDTGVGHDRLHTPPALGWISGSVSPGSAITLNTHGLTDLTANAKGFPLPTELNGVRLRIGSVDAPLLSVSPTSVTAQTPWETGTDKVDDLEVVTPASENSPFVGALTTQVGFRAVWPQVLNTTELDPGSGGYLPIAVHENWSGPITAQARARPGEIVHVYATGLGPVRNQPETGFPASRDTPSPTVLQYSCRASLANYENVSADLLFTGLAPGTAGYYQMDMRLPDANLGAYTVVDCSTAGISQHLNFSILVQQPLRTPADRRPVPRR